VVTTCEDTLYEVLGLTSTASAAEIKAAHLRLARLTHPDVGGSASLFRRVELAYETLSNPAGRRAYDESLRRPGPTEQARREPPDDGWVRVDDPPPGGGGLRRLARLGSWLRARSWRRRGTTCHDKKASVWQVVRPRLRALRGALGVFVSRHPWVALTVGGLVISHVALSTGTLLFLAGLVAGVGAPRARRNSAWRGAASSGISLLFAELAAGIAILFRVIFAIVGALFLMAGVSESHGSPSRRSGR
jgi:hypothetical protein